MQKRSTLCVCVCGCWVALVFGGLCWHRYCVVLRFISFCMYVVAIAVLVVAAVW